MELECESERKAGVGLTRLPGRYYDWGVKITVMDCNGEPMVRTILHPVPSAIKMPPPKGLERQHYSK